MANEAMSEAEWLALQKAQRAKLPQHSYPIDPSTGQPSDITPLTDDDLLASTEPLYNILPRAAVKPYQRREALRMLELQRPAAMVPNGPFDETNPAGRARLIAHLNKLCGITP